MPPDLFCFLRLEFFITINFSEAPKCFASPRFGSEQSKYYTISNK